MGLFSSALGGCFGGGAAKLCWEGGRIPECADPPIYLYPRVLPSQANYSFIDQLHGVNLLGSLWPFSRGPFR